MSKGFRHIALLMGLFLIPGMVQAQIIKFRLEIPAGIRFSGQVLDPMEGGTWENSKAKVWLGIQGHENLTFLLNVEFPEGEILPPPEVYFLNDGSADFETARKLGTGAQELQMKNLPRLIHKMEPRPAHLQPWQGLPNLNGIYKNRIPLTKGPKKIKSSLFGCRRKQTDMTFKKTNYNHMKCP